MKKRVDLFDILLAEVVVVFVLSVMLMVKHDMISAREAELAVDASVIEMVTTAVVPELKPVEIEVKEEITPEPEVEQDIDIPMIEIEEETKQYFDVPLDTDLQDHIFFECGHYGVDPAIVVAMIWKETTFDPDDIGDNGNSFGLMQIQKKWHKDRMKRLGVTDLMNPYQNVTVGVDYLAENLGRGKGLEWALMAYNGGPSYANKMASAGRVSSYAKLVIQYAEGLKEGLE